MALSIEERMELSRILGSPIDGVLDKADLLIKQIKPIVKEMADGPREAVLLLAMAYVYFSIQYATDPEDDVITKAKDFLDSAVGLIFMLGEDDE